MCKAFFWNHTPLESKTKVPVPAPKESVLLHGSLGSESLPSIHSLSKQARAGRGRARAGPGGGSGDPPAAYPNTQWVILVSLLPPVLSFTTSSFPVLQVTLFCVITGDNHHDNILNRTRQPTPHLKNNHKLVFNNARSLLIDNMLVTPMVFHFSPGGNLSLTRQIKQVYF